MGIVLKYFPIMGAAEKVRLALWLGEVEFEDVRVPQVDWAELKGQTPFGQLPVMSIDGGPYIAQSNAMLQYIGTLAPKLCPADQFLQVQEAIGLVDDFERAFRPCIGLALEPESWVMELHLRRRCLLRIALSCLKRLRSFARHSL